MEKNCPFFTHIVVYTILISLVQTPEKHTENFANAQCFKRYDRDGEREKYIAHHRFDFFKGKKVCCFAKLTFENRF